VRCSAISKKIKSGVGFGLLADKKDKPKYSQTLTNIKFLDADVITRYYTPKELLLNVKKAIKTQKAINYYKEFYAVSNIEEIENGVRNVILN